MAAYGSRTGQVLRVLNSPGTSVHDGDLSLRFLPGLLEQLKPGARRLIFAWTGPFLVSLRFLLPDMSDEVQQSRDRD